MIHFHYQARTEESLDFSTFSKPPRSCRSLFPSCRGNRLVSLYLEHRRRARRMLIFVEQSRCASLSLPLSLFFSFCLSCMSAARNRSHLMDNSSTHWIARLHNRYNKGDTLSKALSRADKVRVHFYKDKVCVSSFNKVIVRRI